MSGLIEGHREAQKSSVKFRGNLGEVSSLICHKSWIEEANGRQGTSNNSALQSEVLMPLPCTPRVGQALLAHLSSGSMSLRPGACQEVPTLWTPPSTMPPMPSSGSGFQDAPSPFRPLASRRLAGGRKGEMWGQEGAPETKALEQIRAWLLTPPGLGSFNCFTLTRIVRA